MSLNVLVLDIYADAYADKLRQTFPDLGVRTAHSLAEVPADLSDVDVLVELALIDNAALARAPRLKWIQALTTGVNHILSCPSLRPEVAITAIRGVHGLPLREATAYMLLALTHDAPRIARNQVAHTWERRPWPLLNGRHAVIVGIGVIGTAVAQLLKAFGMRVTGLTRTPRAVDGFDAVRHTDELIAAAGEADYLIDILPGAPQNRNLFGRAVFEAMKPTASFLNVGRGETVDEAALIECLRAGRIAGAALDVFQTEPLPPDSPLWGTPNLIITSHLGGFIQGYAEHTLPTVIENMKLFRQGRVGEMRNIVKR